ncbi:MAG: hypothetical protein ACJAVM_000350 [Sulfitobacter sp.]
MTRQTPFPASSQPLIGLLSRVSAHLDDLAARVYHVEHAIGDEFSTTGPQSADTIQRLQTLDLLRQSLEDLSLLMLYVSQSDSLTDQALSGIDKLTARLHLNATKALLSPYYDPDNPPSRPFSEGEVDLF